jgi:hypothetical protein
MELYVNSNWTERYGNSYIAETIMVRKRQSSVDLHHGRHG